MNSNMYDADLYVQAHTETCTHTHMYTHAHAHNDSSRNWVLIFVGVEILWEENGFLFGFKRGQGWAVSKVLWEWIANVGSKAKVESAKAMCLVFVSLELVFCFVFSEGGCRKMCIVYKT